MADLALGIAGLAVGAVALAGLFTTCVDCFERVELGRHYSRDFTIVETLFESQRLRLIVWGQVVGLVGDVPYNTRLDDAAIRSVIERSLLTLKMLFDDGDRLIRKYGLRLLSSEQGQRQSLVFREVYVRFRERLSASQGQASFGTKAKWAIQDRGKFSDLVSDIKDILDALESITNSFERLPQQQAILDAEMACIYDESRLELIRDATSDTAERISETASLRLSELQRIPGACSQSLQNADMAPSALQYRSIQEQPREEETSDPAASIQAIALQQDKKDCLTSLAFLEIGSRKANIEKPHPDTCKWISNNIEYQQWRNSLSPGSIDILWIKGKPGSGKSILMKHITQETENRSVAEGVFCLSYFFNARGVELEKSPLGLYRTMLCQLLQFSNSSMEAFLPHFLAKQRQCTGQSVTWQTPELSELFQSAILRVESRPVRIFIDAIDECEEDEVRKLIKHLEKCLAMANANASMVKLCLASRHYPNISLRSKLGAELFMEDNNHRDIWKYVHQELELPEQSLPAELKETLIEKSSSVFFWAAFMVRRLSKAYDQGLSAEEMMAVLDKVPPNLEGLFEKTLAGLELDRRLSIARMAPWVIFSNRPLHPYELYTAMVFSARKPPLSLEEAALPAGFDRDRFRKFLIDVSGGLFEIVSPSMFVSDQRVQVIHESVRDFFLGSVKVARIMNLPAETTFLEYSQRSISAACGNFFKIRELRLSEARHGSPAPDSDGYVHPEKLATMFQTPMRTTSDLLTDISRITLYFHDFVFLHIREITRFKDGGLENHATPFNIDPRSIWEGWLAFLYYLVVQTGAVPPAQRRTFYYLSKHASVIGLNHSQLLRIATCVNQFLIFVNKVMKDGFSLKETLHLRQNDDSRTTSDTVLYMRLFFVGTDSYLLGSILPNFGQRVYDSENWVWKDSGRYLTKLDDLDQLLPRMRLRFQLVATRSPELSALETCWRRREFPGHTVPLLHWHIIEEPAGSDQQRSSSVEASLVPENPLFASEVVSWESIMLKALDPDGCNRNSVQYLVPWVYDAMAGHLSKRGTFNVFARRKDSELEHYTMLSI